MDRTIAAMLLLVAACGGGDDAGVVPDGSVVDLDADPTCDTSWELVQVQADSLSLLGSEPPVEGRSVRVGVTVSLTAECDDLAMMTVGYALENEGVVIAPWVWRRVGCTSDGVDVVTRPVVLENLHAATWPIMAAGADDLTVTVGAAPGACNLARDPCQLDCDCDVDAGERCLAYDGFTGPATMCARPCELDRDCNGTTCEGNVTDGLGYVCTTEPECAAGRPCPVGWTCNAGACEPDFVLGNGTRHECTCDADCDPGLRCVHAFDPSSPNRCEATCATDGPWCQGAHMCGSAGQDLSGLAAVDSVCGWLGE